MHLDNESIYSRFLDLQLYYSSRNAQLDEYSAFFDGKQWDDDPEDEEGQLDAEEEVRLVLNYARKSVLWHVGLLTGKTPRVDIPTAGAVANPSVGRRERYLRAILASTSFRRAHRRLEVSANKYGYGVFQALWKPDKGQPKKDVYSKLPFVFRCINPREFFPRYRTYDTPDDFLYVFRFDKGRLVEDIEDQYNVVLSPTDWAPGVRGLCDLIEYWDDERYVLIAVTSRFDEETEEEVNIPTVLTDEKHPYGRVPFFVLMNFVADPDQDPTNGGGLSEVELVEGVNRHLNLIVSLLATEIATRIHPPAVYKSDEPQQDPNNIRLGAGEVIPLGLEEELEVLDWKGVPQTVAEHRDTVISALRDFSGLPKTSMGGSDAASGIGMRLAYAVLEMILPLKLPERVEMLADVLSFLLEISEQQLKKDQRIRFCASKEAIADLRASDLVEDPSCVVEYGNLIPKNKLELEQHIVYLFKTGVIPLRDALERLDVADPDATMERIKEENQDPLLNPEKAALIQQLQQGMGQQPPPPGGQPPAGPAGLKNDAAPPVPQNPAMPSQQNAPFLERGQVPNMGQAMPGSQGVNIGPGAGGIG